MKEIGYLLINHIEKTFNLNRGELGKITRSAEIIRYRRIFYNIMFDRYGKKHQLFADFFGQCRLSSNHAVKEHGRVIYPEYQEEYLKVKSTFDDTIEGEDEVHTEIRKLRRLKERRKVINAKINAIETELKSRDEI